ncbi:MAG: DUF177 domain-containing protein [Fidelibacterota bacterium]|nr:MAG: DUF177 domain-containing protein [Candidatus Neomarinimicrobiota bacterium]
MKIIRSDLQRYHEPQLFRITLFDIGVIDLGAPETPVEVELTVYQQGEDFLLNGLVRTDLRLACDRCLGDVLCPVEGAFKVWLVSEIPSALNVDEEEVLVFQSRKQEVELSSIVAGTIYIELPSKTLCREDCKGFCPTCGTDLNTKPCGCVTEETDERWSVLLAIKQQLEE